MCTCSYLEFLRDLEKKVSDDWEGVSSSLEEIRITLISKNGCLINLTTDGKNLTNSEKYVSKFLDMLPSTSLATTPNVWSDCLPSTNEAIVIPTQVRINSIFVMIYLLTLLPDKYDLIQSILSSGKLRRKSC